MGTSLKMRTSSLSIWNPVPSPWLMLDPTLMDLNSSSAPSRLRGWITSMLSSERLLVAWMLSRRWNLRAHSLGRPRGQREGGGDRGSRRGGVHNREGAAGAAEQAQDQRLLRPQGEECRNAAQDRRVQP